MVDFLEAVEKFDLVERLIRREQIVRDRLTPIAYYNDADFIDFDLARTLFLNVLNDVDDDLNNGIQRKSSVSAFVNFH